MRSIFTAFLDWAPLLTVISLSHMPAMVEGSPTRLPRGQTVVQEYDINNAWARFYLPGAYEVLENPLVFEVQVPPTDDLLTQRVLLNGQVLSINWTRASTEDAVQASSSSNTELRPVVLGHSGWTFHPLVVSDTSGVNHTLTIAMAANATRDYVSSTPDDNVSESFMFSVKTADQQSSGHEFSILVHPQSQHHRLRSIMPAVRRRSGLFDQNLLAHSFTKHRLDEARPRTHRVYYDATSSDEFQDIPLLNLPWPGQQGTDSSLNGAAHREDEHFDIEAEITTLLALEAEAGELQIKIANKKQVISDHLRQHRDNSSMRHLLSQCDGVLCAAKLIAQRICDKMGISTQPSFKYVKVQSPLTQHLLGLDTSSGQEAVKNYTNSQNAEDLPGEKAGPKIDFSHPSDALLTILKIIAGALGLATLFAFLHSKLMPMRKRVERDADREERRNARAYRRAARRANARSRWNTFVRSVNCFRPREETPRNTNYDEKRSLILQDAFLEQDLDQAEKGEVMEAEIRELRNAHELVSSMVRPNGPSPAAPPYHPSPISSDPPPPLVPLPYTPLARSRASSATLPSYTSEILPDYMSRVDTMGSTSGSSNRSGRRGRRHAGDDSESSDFDTGTPSLSSDDDDDESDSELLSSTARSDVGSGRSRGTVLSSLPDIEHYPRISEDTLRTRQSKETRYSREF